MRLKTLSLDNFLIWNLISIVKFIACSTEGGLYPDDRTKAITLTTIVEAGYSDCFYENFKHGSTVNIDYQVISTGNDDNNDITFKFNSPSGRELINEYKQTESSHTHVVNEEGIHELCFDNTFSTFSGKVVFFEIYIERDIDDIPEIHESGRADERGVDLNGFHKTINRIYNSLARIRHMQEIARASESRDYKSIQSKANRVTNWSLLQISVMIVVAIIQVVLVRSLIDERSKFRVLWTFIFKHV